MKSLLLTFLLCIGTCLGGPEPQLIPMASVITNSTGVHKCNAFFYDSKSLITTASCVSCRKCQYHVALSNDQLLGRGRVYDIAEIKIHPNYTRDPDKYNAAKLILREEPAGVVVYTPAKESDLTSYNGTFITWSFNENMLFGMTRNSATYVHRDLYRRATGIHLRDYRISIMSYYPVSIGPYDEGSPFFVQLGENQKPIVYGFFAKPRIQNPGRFFSLISIPHLFQPPLSSFLYNYETTTDSPLYQ